MKAWAFRRSSKSFGGPEHLDMGVSVRRRHSFDQYVSGELPQSRRRGSDVRGKWASPSQLQLRSGNQQRDVEIQVNEAESRSLPAPPDDGVKSGNSNDDEASSNRNPDETEEEDEEKSLSRVSSSGFIAM